ncbi:MAG: amino acid decarboxylase [Alphaproteobacteria bacterium]|nr:amino acid decarboxylase [Alphaproteobacteria bacterium]
MMKANRLPVEETLDPLDWESTRAAAYRMVDESIDRLAGLRGQPVWQPMPDQVRAFFKQPAPRQPAPLDEIYDELKRNLLPHSMGNIHPRFWAWYMGAGNFTGALAEFLGAIDGSNLGGGDTGAKALELQAVDWLKELLGFPETASGTMTSGGSIANLLCLNVARNAMAGNDVRAEGITSLPQPLRFYASDQAHSCGQKALEILGLGARALHIVPSNAGLAMDIGALEVAISGDRAKGFKPVCVIATAGTTNTGSIDDIEAIERICRRENIWFHVDGCIGALLKLSANHAQLVKGIERADSLALDPHKLMQAPFNTSCALIRNRELHRATFTLHHAYLEEKPRGIGSGEFLADYSLELTRSPMALKVWMMLKQHGSEKFGRLIDQNIAQARYLAGLVRAEPKLELMLEPAINIVCFRHRSPSVDEEATKSLNTEIMLRLQEQGIAAPSDTTIHGKHCLRAAIANHRTKTGDLDLLVEAVLKLGAEILGG